ncbi:metallophosphoesterase family protein [Natribaculum luteum]|uniref:Metallophosphoesterase family protein n=1 Tax=Natribaculum luteum TaxID=1586232 RepID=A0ABD5P477_9EURY|nr:metallophosphoesterase family protein [Natribaculum luteum]
MIYIVSDLHLGHDNIIEYCDRPFESTSEMNQTLVENWNDVVEPDDKVLFLGDLVPFEDRPHVVQGWLDKLDGSITFVVGNHDETVPIETHEYLEYEVNDYSLYLTHYPSDIPDDWGGWGIYGHHHNNHEDEFPFFDPDARRINVSVELLGFEPIPVTELFRYIKRGEHLLVRPGADPDRALQSER